MQLIIVSGRSGSGKTIALRVLEDLGFYCVDNLPISLLPTLVHAVIEQYQKIAISIDVRNFKPSIRCLSLLWSVPPGVSTVATCRCTS